MIKYTLMSSEIPIQIPEQLDLVSALPVKDIPQNMDLDRLREEIKYRQLYNGLWSQITNSLDAPIIERALISASQPYDINSETSIVTASSILSDIKIEYSQEEPNTRTGLEVLSWIMDDIRNADGSEDQIDYVHKLQLLLSARTKSLEPLNDYVERFINRNVRREFADSKGLERVVRVLASKSIPHNLAAERISGQVMAIEDQLIGDDPIAAQLWRSAVYLRTSELPQHVTGSSIRKPMFELLVKGDYQGAKLYLEEVLTKYPKLTPEFVDKFLGLEPEVLIKIKAEVIKEQRLDEIRAKIKAENDLISLLNSIQHIELVRGDGIRMRIRHHSGDSTYAVTLIDQNGVRSPRIHNPQGLLEMIDSQGWDIDERNTLFELSGDALKEIRTNNGLTQEEMAIILGLEGGQHLMSNFERGFRSFKNRKYTREWLDSVRNIIKYSKALGIEPQTLLKNSADFERFEQIRQTVEPETN